MKRHSPASSRKRWIAQGPASWRTSGRFSSPSSQKHSAERKEKSRLERKLNTTGSAGACGWAHETTVLVVPKSRPSARGAASCVNGTEALAHDLHARLDELLLQLALDLGHGLPQLRPRKESLLELV